MGSSGADSWRPSTKRRSRFSFTSQGVPFQREVELTIYYDGQPLKCRYKADFVCYGEIIVETKAIRQLTAIERAQVINQLKATRLHRALLVNFGAASLEYERVAG
jgi:GxxExxY protein